MDLLVARWTEREIDEKEMKQHLQLSSMSSLFDVSCMRNMFIVASEGSSSSNLHSDTHTHTHFCPQGFKCGETSSKRTSACLSFFQKQWARWRPRETEREITGRAPYIPSNLMAAVVCPVLTRNEFGPQYSPPFPTSRWLKAWWLQHIKGSLPKKCWMPV